MKLFGNKDNDEPKKEEKEPEKNIKTGAEYNVIYDDPLIRVLELDDYDDDNTYMEISDHLLAGYELLCNPIYTTNDTLKIIFKTPEYDKIIQEGHV